MALGMYSFLELRETIRDIIVLRVDASLNTVMNTIDADMLAEDIIKEIDDIVGVGEANE
jgi:hypothetical protein